MCLKSKSEKGTDVSMFPSNTAKSDFQLEFDEKAAWRSHHFLMLIKLSKETYIFTHLDKHFLFSRLLSKENSSKTISHSLNIIKNIGEERLVKG